MYGYYAGSQANKGLGLRSPDEMPAQLRPYGIAGDMVGNGASISGVTMGLAKAGVESSVPFIQKIFDYARKSPAAFFAGDTATNIAAGTAATATGAAADTPNLPSNTFTNSANSTIDIFSTSSTKFLNLAGTSTFCSSVM